MPCSLASGQRVNLHPQAVRRLKSTFPLLPPGWPAAVLDAGKGMSPESRRSWMEEKSLVLKQTYW